VDYTLSYRMVTGASPTRVGSAHLAVEAHRALLLAGAGNIVMTDEFDTVIALDTLFIAAEVEERLVSDMRPDRKSRRARPPFWTL